MAFSRFSRRRLYPWLFLAVLLGLWDFVTRIGLVDPVILPSPSAFLTAIPGMIRNHGFLGDVAVTLGRVFKALAIAGLIGVPLGLFLGYQQNVYRVLEGPLHALRSVPATALFPLFLIIIGVGEVSIVTLAAYPSLLVILVNAVTGASLANRRRLHQARSLGLGPVRIVTDVLFYEAMPGILNGLRTAASYSLLLVVVVEMFIGIGSGGVGRRIYDYQSTYQIPETYVAIAVAGLIGIALNLGLNWVEKRVLHWVPGVQA